MSRRNTSRRRRRIAAAAAGSLALIAASAVALASTAGTGHGHTADAASISQHVAVPAYIPPSDSVSWNQLTTAGSGLGIVIANPNSGPGTAVDAAWQKVIDATHGNGTDVIGYVDTGYFGFTGRQTAGGSTTAADWMVQAKRDVDKWYSLYGGSGGSVDGIFFDDVLNQCGPGDGSEQYVALYRELNAYVHTAHQGSLTVVNPGASVSQCYGDAADILVTFEGSKVDYLKHTPPSWQRGADPDRFWNIVYDVPRSDLDTVMAAAKENNAGYVYVTDRTLAVNPYYALPDNAYFTAELVAAQGTKAAGKAAPKSASSLPPTHAGFDYQIGGAYAPPAGVTAVSRDHEASPASGLYNICYVNAFQVQPGAEDEWDADLLLRDGNGDVVYDDDWGEAMLDLRTAEKRQRAAAKVNGWIDGCAGKGFQAVEPDNYDSYTRSQGLLSASDAEAYISLLSAHAHNRGLAIAQKNTLDLAGDHLRTGLDFAIVEECGAWDECGDFTDAFGNNVIVIEYTSRGLAKACSDWGDRLSIVQRDVEVSTAGSSGYVRRVC